MAVAGSGKLLQLGVTCWIIFSLVSCKPNNDLFESFLKSKDKLKTLYNIISSTPAPTTARPSTLAHPTSYAMIESEEKTTEPATATINDSDTESPLQECFNQIAADNYPRMLDDMKNLTSAEIERHPVYKMFYYTAKKSGKTWREFYETISSLSDTQIRDSLKLVNAFGKISKKGGLDENDKAFLQDYQKDLFQDFNKLNNVSLTDDEKKEVAEHYKKKPHFLKENNELQQRLENVMAKFSSDEIRNDPGLRNMRHVGIDPEQFVTLKHMVEDKIKDQQQMNQTIQDMIDANRYPEPKNLPRNVR